MSKGIVVMDIPEQCDMCPLSYEGISIDFCTIADKEVVWNQKPDWCPIKPLPEKIQHKSRQGLLQEQVALGWNLCIDEIKGE